MLCAYPVCVCLRYAKPVFPTQFGMAVQTDAKLWMGELDPNMDDNYLTQLWASVGYIVSARVIRGLTLSACLGVLARVCLCMYFCCVWLSVCQEVNPPPLALLSPEKGSNMSQGYGFVNFQSLQHAQVCRASSPSAPKHRLRWGCTHPQVNTGSSLSVWCMCA